MKKSLWRRVTPVLVVALVGLMAAGSASAAPSGVTVVRTILGSGTGTWQFGFAFCPPGKHATGGGVALNTGSDLSLYEEIGSSGPADSSLLPAHLTTGSVPTGWYGDARIDAGSSSVTVWVECTSAPTTVVRTTLGTSMNTWHTGYARCRTGQRATGGGIAMETAGHPGVYQSIANTAPVDSSGSLAHTTTGTIPVQWYGSAYIQASQSTSYLYAVCAKTLTPTVVRVTASSSQGFNLGIAVCRNGTRATGGGVALSGNSTRQFISDEGPTNNTSNFSQTATGAIPTEWRVTSYVVAAGVTAYGWAVCG